MRITLVPIRDSHNSHPSEMTSAVALTSTENESGVWLHVTLPYGGTDFVNGCRSAIAEERWCDLVESIAALEHEHVRGGRLRWGKDADGNRIAVEIEPGRYQIPADLYPGHPFDAKKEQ